VLPATQQRWHSRLWWGVVDFGNLFIETSEQKFSLRGVECQKEEEGFTQTSRSTVSELIPFTALWASEGCSIQLRQHTTKSRPGGRLKLTASAFNQLWINCWQSWSEYLLLRRTRCILYQLPPLLLTIFWVLWCWERKHRQTHRQSVWSGRYFIQTVSAPASIVPHFYAKCRYYCNPPSLSWLGTGTE